MYEGPYGRNLRSAEIPTLKPNSTSIGKAVAKLWPFLKTSEKTTEYNKSGKNYGKRDTLKTAVEKDDYSGLSCTCTMHGRLLKSKRAPHWIPDNKRNCRGLWLLHHLQRCCPETFFSRQWTEEWKKWTVRCTHHRCPFGLTVTCWLW